MTHTFDTFPVCLVCGRSFAGVPVTDRESEPCPGPPPVELLPAHPVVGAVAKSILLTDPERGTTIHAVQMPGGTVLIDIDNRMLTPPALVGHELRGVQVRALSAWLAGVARGLS